MDKMVGWLSGGSRDEAGRDAEEGNTQRSMEQRQ